MLFILPFFYCFLSNFGQIDTKRKKSNVFTPKTLDFLLLLCNFPNTWLFALTTSYKSPKCCDMLCIFVNCLVYKSACLGTVRRSKVLRNISRSPPCQATLKSCAYLQVAVLSKACAVRETDNSTLRVCRCTAFCACPPRARTLFVQLSCPLSRGRATMSDFP